MKNLDFIADELFNKIRGRFPSITIGNDNGEVTNIPKEARFFDFEYKEGNKSLGKVSVSLDEKTISVMYSDDFAENEDTATRQHWYAFLKELRQFSRKRLLNFDTRNITKSNLDKRDYKFLATNRPGEDTMVESKMYGTSRTSYQDVGNARLAIKHNQPVNQMMPAGRTQHIESIYIESSEGERFKYPYRHLNGARAMARHVGEGGKPFDDFGSHITSLSEELSKLKKFKTYMGRSSVMAEGLNDYLDAVNERIDTVKSAIHGLQRETYYKEAIAGFTVPVMEEVPTDVAENWIDQLTIRQFNEELKDVFPYIYRLVSEHTRAKELGPEDMLGEGTAPYYVDTSSGKPTVKVDGASTVPLMVSKKFTDITPDVAKRANSQGFMSVEVSVGGKKFPALLSGEKAFVSQQVFDQITGSAPTTTDAASAKAKSPIGNMLDRVKGSFKEFQNWAEDLEAGALSSGNDETAKFAENDPAQQIAKDVQAVGIVQPQKFAPGEIRPSQLFGHPKWRETVQMMHKKFPGNSDKAMQAAKDAITQLIQKSEGNAYAHAVQQAKMQGKKKGDKVPHPNGDDQITLEQEIPVTEFVLSLYDRNTGTFPKGETAVLTAIEKDYGESFIEPAKQFIERINQTFEQFQMQQSPQQLDPEFQRMKELAGLR